MRLLLLGSDAFTLPTLRALLTTRHGLVAVVTQPDRPAGRGHAPTPPPVKVAALEAGLSVLQPENVSAIESVEQIRDLAPDVFIVAAYGQILRQRLLDVPSRGSLNVHASLLPRHRGASPVAASILAGDAQGGVTIMEVVRALDAGPIVASVAEPILPADTTASLEARLAEAGARLLIETLDGWAERRIIATPQDDSLSTYAPQINRADARIDWSLPAEELWRRVRAFNPWPVAFTSWRGEELRVWQAWPLPGNSGETPGNVLAPETLPAEAGGSQTFSVQTGEGRLAIVELQRAGRRSLSGVDFLRGQRDFVGSRLGESA